MEGVPGNLCSVGYYRKMKNWIYLIMCYRREYLSINRYPSPTINLYLPIRSGIFKNGSKIN